MSGAQYKSCSECGATKGARGFRGDSDTCRACEGTLDPRTVAKLYPERIRQERRNPGSYGGPSAPVPGLRATRESLGLSRGKLARISGVSENMIAYLEVDGGGASEAVRERLLFAVVNERRRQREAEMERWERLQKAGVGPLPATTKRTPYPYDGRRTA